MITALYVLAFVGVIALGVWIVVAAFMPFQPLYPESVSLD